MHRRSWVLMVVVLAACGDESEPTSFEIVGHSEVGARGMNSGIAIAGDVVYIGSRNDKRGVAAIDISDPASPTLVGEVIPAVSGQSSRELRAIADLDLLVVLNLDWPPDLHGCSGATPAETLTLYDAENQEPFCATPHDRVAFTAHNATVMHDLALVTWYAGGILAVDISDAKDPTTLTALRPEPLASVAAEDPGLGGDQVEMWSYPVIQDGLIYVADVRNGLYVLRYHGPWSDQVDAETFLEGNSNL